MTEAGRMEKLEKIKSDLDKIMEIFKGVMRALVELGKELEERMEGVK